MEYAIKAIISCLLFPSLLLLLKCHLKQCVRVSYSFHHPRNSPPFPPHSFESQRKAENYTVEVLANACMMAAQRKDKRKNFSLHFVYENLEMRGKVGGRRGD